MAGIEAGMKLPATIDVYFHQDPDFYESTPTPSVLKHIRNYKPSRGDKPNELLDYVALWFETCGGNDVDVSDKEEFAYPFFEESDEKIKIRVFTFDIDDAEWEAKVVAVINALMSNPHGRSLFYRQYRHCHWAFELK